MRKLVLLVISALAMLSSPAFAKDNGAAAWTVSQLSGDARVVHVGLQPASLKVQSRLVPGDTIVTGLTGRATLTRGADYIIIAPRSELQLPSTPEPSGFTRVIQNLGTMLFKVRHTGVPHFSVDTPMLAAVVKGTTFSVIVDKDRSAVQVIQGAVQVTAIDGGMSRIVEGGKTVFIDRASPKRLIDADEHSPATSSATGGVKLNGSQTPSVAAIANLTEGLVHPGTATPTATSKPNSATDTVVAAVTQPTVNFANAALAGGTDTLGGVTDSVTDVVDATVPDVLDPVTDVVDTATNVIDTGLPGVTDTVADVVDTTTDIVDTTLPGVTDTVTDVVDTATDVIDTTVPGVTDTVTDVVGSVIDIVDNSGPGSNNSGPGSNNSGPGSLTDVVDTTTDIVDTTVADATNTVTNVVDTVTNVVDTTVPEVTQTVTSAVDSLLGGLFHH